MHGQSKGTLVPVTVIQRRNDGLECVCREGKRAIICLFPFPLVEGVVRPVDKFERGEKKCSRTNIRG